MIRVYIYHHYDPVIKTSAEILKSHLQELLNRPQKDIVIQTNANGKPFTDGIHFSISHCQNKLLLAFSFESLLGADLELIDPQRQFLSIAQRRFSASEIAKMKDLNLQQQARLFFQLWSRKEALCKLEGGRLWFYLSENQLTERGLWKDKINNTYVCSYNEVPGFSLSVASSEKQDDIQFIHA